MASTVIERERRDNPDHDLVVYKEPKAPRPVCQNISTHTREGRPSIGRQVRTDSKPWIGINGPMGPDMPVCERCHRANGYGTTVDGWAFIPW